jgi:hypothetical protein
MTLEEIELLVRQADARSVATFEYEENGCFLRLAFANGTSKTPDTSASGRTDAAIAPTPSYIRAPAAGVFQSSHPFDAQPMALERTHVRDGQIIGFLRTGAVLRPVTAADGVLGARIAPEGELVGFGAPLFLLEQSRA